MVVIERPIPTRTKIKLPATPDQVLLDRTANILEHGWTTGTFVDTAEEGKPRYCLIGALRYAYAAEPHLEASSSDSVYKAALYRLTKALGFSHRNEDDCDCIDCMETPLIEWNDHFGDDFDGHGARVIQTVREAAVA